MSFSANYTLDQLSKSTIKLTDSSTGTDSNLTSRHIFLYKADGTTIVPSGTTTTYIVWDIGDSTITLTDIFDKDYAVNIDVEWISSSPITGSTYSKELLNLFTDYLETFYYGLTQDQATKPNIINDTEYFNNKSKLRTFIDDAAQAVSKGNDISSAQMCLDFAQEMIDNANIYF